MIFGTFCMAALIHVFLVFQETNGKTLEEMDEVFENQSIWAFRNAPGQSRLPVDVEKARRVVEGDGKAFPAVEGDGKAVHAAEEKEL